MKFNCATLPAMGRGLLVLCSALGGTALATHNDAWDYGAFCAQVEAGALPTGTVSVRDPQFDAVGATDDLGRLRKAARFVCGHPGATLVFPSGVYRIDRTRDARDTNIAHWGVLYRNCRNVRVVGCRAKIEVKGDFHKTKTHLAETATLWYANEVQMTPFLFENSRHFVLKGFEIDGNSEQLTFDPEINAETPDHGIQTVNAHDYRMEDIYVHHFAGDGLYIGSGSLDFNFALARVESANNGRNALSLIQIRKGVVRNSIFRDAGSTGAHQKMPDGSLRPFPGFSPQAGVGVEPDCKLTPQVTCPGFDRKGGQVVFDQCKLLNNGGSGFSSAHSDVIEDMTVRRSVIQNPAGSTAFPLFLGDGIVEDTVIQAEQGRVFLAGEPSRPEDEVIFRRNTVTGGGVRFSLLHAEGEQSSVLIEDNLFMGNFTKGPAIFPMLYVVAPEGERHWRFLRNWIGVPDNAFAPDYANSSITLGYLLESSGNRFRSLGLTPWIIDYTGTQAIHDQLTRPGGLLPVDWSQAHSNLEGCVDGTGDLVYTVGSSACAQ